ncbi:MAG: cytochrome c [Syntrophobacterales bacterium]|jgi:mono/diheme cytochrome c family protein|nr:cytochrome c [Syntrophobacterales bacterium]
MKRILIWALIGIFGGTALMSGKGTAADGRSLYNDKCSLCHGVRGDGKGPAGPTLSPPATDFTNPSYWQKTNDTKIADAVNNGVGAMPAFDLNPGEIKSIINYMRTFKK